MNSFDWNNPPPPGTEFDPLEEDSNISSQNIESSQASIDMMDRSARNPSPDEIVREKSRSRGPDRRKHRRRSRSRSRRSRSYSRDRRRRSRSKRRRRKYSSSRSRSRSPGYRHRHRRHGHRRSRSRSYTRKRRSHRSRSADSRRSRSYRHERDRKSPKSQLTEEKRREDVLREEDMNLEDEDDDGAEEGSESEDQASVPFKNDGSFLEMFKKMQEEQKANEAPPEEALAKKPVLPTFGKRRGGKVLKTGMVAKVRNTEEEEANNATDAWSIYMKEVRRYKEVHCDDDSKTRPLVK